MGWGKDVEDMRLKRLGVTPQKAAVAEKKKQGSFSSLALVGVVGAVALGSHLWKERKRLFPKLFKAGGKGQGGGRSPFSFGKPKKATPAKAEMKGVAATPNKLAGVVPRDDNLPRNKKANNKKNKARKQEKKENKAIKEMMAKVDAEVAAKSAKPAAGGNGVPKDEDIVGGALGKTFTTTTNMKVSTGYAKIRETVGKD